MVDSNEMQEKADDYLSRLRNINNAINRWDPEEDSLMYFIEIVYESQEKYLNDLFNESIITMDSSGSRNIIPACTTCGSADGWCQSWCRNHKPRKREATVD